MFCVSFWCVHQQWQLQSAVKLLISSNTPFSWACSKNKQGTGFASEKYASSKVSNSRKKSYLNCAKNFEGSVTTHFTVVLFSCPAAVLGGVRHWCSQLLLLGDLQLQFFWDRAIDLLLFFFFFKLPITNLGRIKAISLCLFSQLKKDWHVAAQTQFSLLVLIKALIIRKFLCLYIVTLHITLKKQIKISAVEISQYMIRVLSYTTANTLNSGNLWTYLWLTSLFLQVLFNAGGGITFFFLFFFPIE